MKSKRTKGFTLIEVFVVMVIVMAAVVIGVSAFMGLGGQSISRSVCETEANSRMERYNNQRLTRQEWDQKFDDMVDRCMDRAAYRDY